MIEGILGVRGRGGLGGKAREVRERPGEGWGDEEGAVEARWGPLWWMSRVWNGSQVMREEGCSWSRGGGVRSGCREE